MKIGRLICGWNNQVPEPPLNRPSRSGLKVPALAVRLMLGKNAARAAPMLAFCALSKCSASRMSGRRCNRSDGKPSGTSLSSSESSGLLAARLSGRPVPSSNTRRLRSWATRRLYLASCALAFSTEVRDWLRSSAEATPTSLLRAVSL
ncbi:hypothetical protein D3C81_1749810 [compost metagenome]